MPCSFILFDRPDFDLEAASSLLGKRGLTVETQANKLLVTWQDGPQLSVFLARGEDVRREAQEIVGDTGYKGQFGTFDTRFEIVFDDPDAVLDEINTLIEVQASLQEATGGFLFNTWNGSVMPPE